MRESRYPIPEIQFGSRIAGKHFNCCAHHEADQAADGIAHEHGWRIDKLLQEVQQLVAPQLGRVCQRRLVARPKSQQIDRIHLQQELKDHQGSTLVKGVFLLQHPEGALLPRFLVRGLSLAQNSSRLIT